MPEGLSPQEVGKEIAGHAEESEHQTPTERRDRIVSILEAVLLVDRRSAGGLVRLRGGEVEHRVAGWAGGSLGREDEGEPGRP